MGSAVLNGIPPQAIRDVWGVAKAYETYVGSKTFEQPSPVFSKIRDLGKEFGATTGRPRQCGWLEVPLLEKSVKINGVNKLVFNKMDILEELNRWMIKHSKDSFETFEDRTKFEEYFNFKLKRWGVEEVYFSDSPETI